MKFGIRRQLTDVITCVKLLVSRFRGYRVLTPQIAILYHIKLLTDTQYCPTISCIIYDQYKTHNSDLSYYKYYTPDHTLAR